MYRIPVAASIPVPVPEVSKTVITFTNGSSYTIEHPSTGEPLDNVLLVSEGVKSDNYTWKYQPVNASIGNRVTSIGWHVFAYCRNLTNVTIPDSVTIIGDRAFNNCTSLTDIKIGNGVESIKDFAFAYCSNLTSVTTPDSVTSIG